MSRGADKLEAELGDSPQRQFGRKTANSIFPKPQVSAIVDTTEKLANALLVDISLIDPDPNNPRIVFDEEAMTDLATSIGNHGVQQPILIRTHEGRWRIVEGQRRWMGSKMAGKTHIPCVVTDINSKDILLLQLHLNCQRIDLGPVEMGRSFARLIKEHQWTEREAAASLNKSQSYVHKVKAISELPEKIQKEILAKNLTFTQAYNICVKLEKQNKPKPTPRQTSIRYVTSNGRLDLVVKTPNATASEAEAVLLEALEQCRANQKILIQEAA